MLHSFNKTRGFCVVILLATMLLAMPAATIGQCRCAFAHSLVDGCVNSNGTGGDVGACCCSKRVEPGNSSSHHIFGRHCANDCPCQCNKRDSDQQFFSVADQEVLQDHLDVGILRSQRVRFSRAISRMTASCRHPMTALNRCISLSRFLL